MSYGYRDPNNPFIDRQFTSKGDYNKKASKEKQDMLGDLKDDLAKLDLYIEKHRSIHLVMQANVLRNLLDYTYKEVRKTKVRI